MEERARPTILEANHIQRAISDPNFYAAMPEFLPVKHKVDSLNANASLSSGCPSCRNRRIAGTVNSDFVSVLNSLTPDGYARLKKYIGAEKLLVRSMDRKAGHTVLREV